METSPPFEFAENIDRRVDQLACDASKSGAPYDFEALAADLQIRLEQQGVDGLEPADEGYWRVVLAALRRRAGLPV